MILGFAFFCLKTKGKLPGQFVAPLLEPLKPFGFKNLSTESQTKTTQTISQTHPNHPKPPCCLFIPLKKLTPPMLPANSQATRPPEPPEPPEPPQREPWWRSLVRFVFERKNRARWKGGGGSRGVHRKKLRRHLEVLFLCDYFWNVGKVGIR